jgi:TPR repeat protein
LTLLSPLAWGTCLLAGAALCLAQFGRLYRLTGLRRRPLVGPGALTPGPAAVYGQAGEAPGLLDPVYNLPCAYFSVTVKATGLFSGGRRLYSGDSGDTPFPLSDPGGTVLVRAGGALVAAGAVTELAENRPGEASSGNPPDPAAAAFLGGVKREGGARLRALIIRPGDELRVWGVALPPGPGAMPELVSGEGGRLLLTGPEGLPRPLPRGPLRLAAFLAGPLLLLCGLTAMELDTGLFRVSLRAAACEIVPLRAAVPVPALPGESPLAPVASDMKAPPAGDRISITGLEKDSTRDERLCGEGGQEACVRTAARYLSGHGAPKNTGKALPLLKGACGGGIAEACTLLGLIYLQGDGVPADPRAGALHVRRGCEAGDPRACAMLGAMYNEGRGLPKDDKKAFALFEKSCAAGTPVGCALLGAAYADARGVQRDFEKAKTYMSAACKAGDQLGCRNLMQLQVALATQAAQAAHAARQKK